MGDHGVLETTDLGLEGVSRVKEDDVVAALIDQFVDLLGFEMDAAPDDAALVDLQLLGCTERDDLVTNANPETREVVGRSFGLLEVDSLETRELLGCGDIVSQIVEIATERAVDAVARNEYPTLERELFAERSLPKSNGLGIVERGETVIKNDLLRFHTSSVPMRTEWTARLVLPRTRVQSKGSLA